MANEIISRADAIAQGLKRYFTGKPCKHGHVAERQTTNQRCLACHRVGMAQWNKANPEKARATSARCYQATREKRLAGSARWRKTNLERARANAIRWAKANRDKRRAADARWRKANPEKRRAAFKNWAKANPESVRAQVIRWRKANPEKARAASANRRARKANGGSHTGQDLQAILEVQRHRCAECRASFRKVKRHLDHIVPLSRGGSNDRKNLQYLCARCNLTKSAKDPLQFAQERGRLL